MRRHDEPWRGTRPEGLEFGAPNAVYSIVTTGEEVRGRDEVRRMLQHVYRKAFDARVQAANMLIGEATPVLKPSSPAPMWGSSTGSQPQGGR